MADWERFEITTKRVVYRVKSPAALAELGKTMQAARLECAKQRGVDPAKLFDNDVMVMSFDQDIHVYFEYEVRE